MTDPSISGVFREPFQEQVAFFRQKLGNLVPTERWTDMQKEAHDRGFMVAGAAKADLLSDLAAAVDKAISQGTSLDAFRKDFKAIAARNGWDYRGEFNWRTKVIYQTNMATSYSAGRLAQLRDAGFTHWEYIHSNAVAHPRQQHLAWNGLVLPADAPFWNSHYPPNGWGCQCRVKGKNNPSGIGQAPPEEIDPKTGEPVGIDKGWGYQPGNTTSSTVSALAARTVQWKYELAKAYMENLPEGIKDQFSRSYRSLPSTRDAARQFAGRVLDERNHTEYQSMGLLTSDDSAKIQELKGIDVSGYDFALDPSSVKHIQKKHGDLKSEALRGQRAVTKEDYEKIPELLNSPDEIIDSGNSHTTGSPLVEYAKEIKGEKYALVLEYRKKRKMMAVTTFYIQGGK